MVFTRGVSSLTYFLETLILLHSHGHSVTFIITIEGRLSSSFLRIRDMKSHSQVLRSDKEYGRNGGSRRARSGYIGSSGSINA